MTPTAVLLPLLLYTSHFKNSHPLGVIGVHDNLFHYSASRSNCLIFHFYWN